MTEEEAKTKWCPHAVASHTDPRAGFHTGDADWPTDQPKVFACLASACMAWRLQSVLVSRSGHYSDAPEGNGFCGLAGSPS